MENPIVLILSGLLVQPDEGVSDLVVDRIGVTTAINREEPGHTAGRGAGPAGGVPGGPRSDLIFLRSACTRRLMDFITNGITSSHGSEQVQSCEDRTTAGCGVMRRSTK
ncbi:hypothetical protein F511_35686 [Dorcoceras hygrometricum]|uniref:Uncharacterized protein n=1 Tax=Dorcoceras hygrometricum TaxID=472368 RepID=A0A2Z7AT28_9LAMI|nr:hypothetical protein F511_35686 [Dorcoceras hygrometricum]